MKPESDRSTSCGAVEPAAKSHIPLVCSPRSISAPPVCLQFTQVERTESASSAHGHAVLKRVKSVLSAWPADIRSSARGRPPKPDQRALRAGAALSMRRRCLFYKKSDEKAPTVNVSNLPYPSPALTTKETEVLGTDTLQLSVEPRTSLFPFVSYVECIRDPISPIAADHVVEQRQSGEPLSVECTFHRAIGSHQPDNPAQLGFDADEVLIVFTKCPDGWWYARRLSSSEAGWIPSRCFNTEPILKVNSKIPVALLPRRARTVCQKQSAYRRGVYGRVELNGEDSIQFYQHVAQQLLSLRDCAVCGESKALANFPNEERLQCEHECATCRDCAQAWIAVELENKGWNHIKCPAVDCKALLGHEDVLQLADSATFSRYDSLATRSYLSTLPGFRWCLSPACNSGQIHDDTTGPTFRCVGCAEQFCTWHETPWHRSETCKQYDKRAGRENQAREEQATRMLLSETAKKCPNKKCPWLIEKVDGCAHMTCGQCAHEFCWECLAPYKPIAKHGPKRHKPTCDLYEQKLG